MVLLILVFKRNLKFKSLSLIIKNCGNKISNTPHMDSNYRNLYFILSKKQRREDQEKEY